MTGGIDEFGNYLIWMYKEDYNKLIKNKIDIDCYIIQRLNKRWTKLSKQLICLNFIKLISEQINRTLLLKMEREE